MGKTPTAEGGDVSTLYQDDGYLFFRVDPIETAVYNDTIDFEIRIVEGPQATIKTIRIAGNEKTKDFVIRREIRTLPGDKFSRSLLIRSQREIAQLNFFDQDNIPDQHSKFIKKTADLIFTFCSYCTKQRRNGFCTSVGQVRR